MGAMMLSKREVLAEINSSGLNVEISGKLALCNHSERGEIILNVSGGIAPYTYQWSNGAESSMISDLNTGTYTVKITDAGGDWISRTIIIQPPFVLTTELVNQMDASCDGNNDGEIELRIIRGRQPFKIQWSHGLEGVTKATALAPGSYSVSVTDFYECTNTIEFVISSGGGMEIVPEIKNLSCDELGSISVDLKGGTAPFAYQWAHGPVTKDLDQLEAGIYTLKVLDSKGCSIEKKIEIIHSDPLALEWVKKIDVMCAGSASGLAELNIKGGQAPFKVEWTDDVGESSLVRRDLKAGSYELKVEDRNGCVVTESFAIKEPAPFTVKMDTRLEVNCSSSATEGFAWINITGGEGPYEIVWSNGIKNTNEISFQSAGSIAVEVRDSKGCIAIANNTVVFPTFNARLNPIVKLIDIAGREEFEVDDAIQFRSNVPEDALAWEWDFGDGSLSDELNPTHSYLKEGEYKVTLTVHNLYGCATSDTHRLVVEDRSAVMMVPTAFSPNGDGLNDTFIPKWKNITAFEMQIYNTWGELLFSTAEMESNGWTGYLQGRLVPRGSYVYKITFTTLKGEKKQKSGVFTLVK